MPEKKEKKKPLKVHLITPVNRMTEAIKAIESSGDIVNSIYLDNDKIPEEYKRLYRVKKNTYCFSKSEEKDNGA